MPISAISSGLGIIIPLYILALHGSVINVGFAITLYNLVAIPSSLFWGKMTDWYGTNRHKLFIIGSILGIFPVLFILRIVTGPHAVEAVYGLYALVATAASPSINILVMGTERNPGLPKFFSRYSIFGISGSLLAMIPGLLIGQGGILYYLYFLLAVNLAGLVFAAATIRELKPKQLPRAKIKAAHRIFPALNALSTHPNLLTGPKLIERLHRIFDGEYRNFEMLLVAIALFNGGMNLFNTSYIPYLKRFGMSYSSIFAINIVNAFFQLSVYLAVAYLFTRRTDLHRYYSASAWIRGASYIIVIVPLFVAFGTFFYTNMVGYAFGGIAYAMWNIAASVLLYDSIRNSKKVGYYIGVWVAILGLSAVVGSLLSGIASELLGYSYTFVAAAIITFASALIFKFYYSGSDRIRREKTSRHLTFS